MEYITTLVETKNKEPNWIAIEDPPIAKQILEAFGDADKKNILNTVLDESKIISDILEITQLSQTSGYRKVNSLIDSGLLIVQGYTTTPDGKKVNKYRSIFENVIINIEKNKVIVKIFVTKNVLEQKS